MDMSAWSLLAIHAIPWEYDLPFSGLELPVSELVDTGIMLSVRAASPWKRLRFLTISFEKSLVP